LNKGLHAANPMPKRPTEAERIQWHLAHAEACDCRPIPTGLMAKIGASHQPDSPA